MSENHYDQCDNFDEFLLKKTKKPHDSNFKQQRMSKYHPDFLSRNFSMGCLLLAIVYLIFGSFSFYSNYKINEIRIDYTNCLNQNSIKCSDYIKNNKGYACQCSIDYQIHSAFDGPIYIYYEITNLYRNHRYYSNSFDREQLLGHLNEHPSSTCQPFIYDQSKPIFPCGSVANSYFNDTYHIKDDKNHELDIKIDKISYDSSSKFMNPDMNEVSKNFIKPPNWPKPISSFGEAGQMGLDYQHFQNWMVLDPFPNVVKLYGIIVNNMNRGDYKLIIDYNWDSISFDGYKSLILTNTSFFGGKNFFISYLLLICGIFGLFVGLYSRIVSNKYDTSYSLPLFTED